MIKYLIIVICAICICSVANASPVYKTNGEVIKSASVKIQEFSTRKEAEVFSLKVDGQVFKEQDQELYRVIWGNVKINDVVLISSME